MKFRYVYLHISLCVEIVKNLYLYFILFLRFGQVVQDHLPRAPPNLRPDKKKRNYRHKVHIQTPIT